MRLNSVIEQIKEAHKQRTSRLAEIKAETEHQLANIAQMRQLVATNQQQQLNEDKSIRQELVTTMLNDFATNRKQQAINQQQQLTEETTARRASVATLLTDFATSREQQAIAQQQQLTDGVEERQAEVEAMLQNLTVSRQQMALHQQSQLDIYVAGLRHDVQKELQETAQTRQTTAKTQQQQLAKETAQRRADTKTLVKQLAQQRAKLAVIQQETFADQTAQRQQELAGQLQYFAKEQQKRQQIVTELSQEVQQTLATFRDQRGAWSANPEPSIIAAESETDGATITAQIKMDKANPISSAQPTNLNSLPTVTQPKNVEPQTLPNSIVISAKPDDLTVLRGIGPKTQQRLYQAGISTYKTLGQSSPDTLLQILYPNSTIDDPDDLNETLENMVRFNKVQEWIEQAKEIGE